MEHREALAERQRVASVPFCDQPGLCGEQVNQSRFSGPGGCFYNRAVKGNKDLPLCHAVSFTDMDGFHYPTFQMLHGLLITFDSDLPPGQDCALERGKN